MEGQRRTFLEIWRSVRSQMAQGTQLNWNNVYELLGMKKEYELFTKVCPELTMPHTKLWTIPVLSGLNHVRVVDGFEKLNIGFYTCTSCKEDLDKPNIIHLRHPNQGNYTVKVLQVIEASEDGVPFSDSLPKSNGLQPITVLERLLLELGYFMTTGKHLDVVGLTLCAGSYTEETIGQSKYPDVFFTVKWREDLQRVYLGWRYATEARNNDELCTRLLR